jgi:hypothetical protein
VYEFTVLFSHDKGIGSVGMGCVTIKRKFIREQFFTLRIEEVSP